MATQTQGANNHNTGGDKQPDALPAYKDKKKVASYFLLPGIIPEIKNLASNRLGYLAYLIAMIYQMVRILPANHPYTKPDNIGKFTIRQAIAAAAQNIEVSKNNIDQMIVFVAILAGLLLMVVQFISFLFFLFMGSAWAGGPGPGLPSNTAEIFITQNPNADIAFYMIREVFGLPEMFGLLGTTDNGPIPEGAITGEDAITPLHLALHKLFEFYNIAILIVAILVFIYYVIVVIGETAQTGSPFGQRFSKIYAPFRLVIAIGLLVPLSYGFNGAQYIAFYAAKLGSSFATNGWHRFNNVVSDQNPLGVESATLIAQPNVPDMSGLVEAISVARTCKVAYFLRDDIVIDPYFIDRSGAPQRVGGGAGGGLDSYLAQYDTLKAEALASGRKGHVSIYFGDDTDNENNVGGLSAYCGEIKIPIQQADQTTLAATGDGSPVQIERYYFALTMFLWNHPEIDALGEDIAELHHEDHNPCVGRTTSAGNCEVRVTPPKDWQKLIIDEANMNIEAAITRVYDAARGQIDYRISPEVLETGWGGAGIWYNKISQANGAFAAATVNIPHMVKRPDVMKEVLEAKQKADTAFIDCKAYEANLADNKRIDLSKGVVTDYYGLVLNETYQYWRCNRSGRTANFFWDSISSIFGLNGLFNIRDTVQIGTSPPPAAAPIMASVHPLAALSSLGKSLVDSSITNMGLAVGTSFGGGILGTLTAHLGPAFQGASTMFVSIATIGLSIGFLLYYLLPLLPFMYFFFAVGGWVKGLFEAMVGTPLWAVAHLRIDGEGLPGKSAMSGYILIFEIFLRPILTVAGLIGGLAIFTALANTLNDIFTLVVANITGTDIGGDITESGFDRSLVDKFFFTIIYAMVLYMMAIASFKMITMVPNSIMRWMNQSAEAFNDKAEDPAGNITQYATIGTQQIGGKLAQGTTQLGQGAGSAIGEFSARFATPSSRGSQP